MSTESEKAAGMVAAMASSLKKNKELHRDLMLAKSHINKLEGDVLTITSVLSSIVRMKSEKYSKWNLWHTASRFFMEAKSRMYFPENIKSYIDAYEETEIKDLSKGDR